MAFLQREINYVMQSWLPDCQSFVLRNVVRAKLYDNNVAHRLEVLVK